MFARSVKIPSPNGTVKDGKSYLDEGDIKSEPIAGAIADIGYQGWIVLETSGPSKNAVAGP